MRRTGTPTALSISPRSLCQEELADCKDESVMGNVSDAYSFVLPHKPFISQQSSATQASVEYFASLLAQCSQRILRYHTLDQGSVYLYRVCLGRYSEVKYSDDPTRGALGPAWVDSFHSSG